MEGREGDGGRDSGAGLCVELIVWLVAFIILCI